MKLTLIDEAGQQWVEGPVDSPLMATANDVRQIIEACAWFQVNDVLLYAANLPPAFFDLSSGDAGEILQKLQNYQVRLAVVCPPGSVRYSTRFGDVLAEAPLGQFFKVFEHRDAARAWLDASEQPAA